MHRRAIHTPLLFIHLLIYILSFRVSGKKGPKDCHMFAAVKRRVPLWAAAANTAQGEAALLSYSFVSFLQFSFSFFFWDLFHLFVLVLTYF